MAEIRINKLLKKYNVGLNELVDFLQKQGAQVENNPNAKVSEDFVPALDRHFSKDLEMKEKAEKVDIKLAEILEKSGRKQEKPEAEDFEPFQETIIKSSMLTDFSHKAAQAETEPVAEPEPVQAPEVKPVEPVAEPAPKVEPVVESKPEPAPVPEVKPAEPVAAPKVEPVVESKPEPAPVPEVKPAEPVADPEPTPVPEVKPVAPVTAPAPKVEPVKVVAPAATVVAAAAPSQQGGLQVVGKIDLSQFDKKKSKRERIAKGSQKVDVTKAGASQPAQKQKNGNNNNNGKNNNNGNANGGRNGNNNGNNARHDQQGKGGKGKKGQDRFTKPAMTEAEQEEQQRQIQKQVKETYAKMNDNMC